jgi:hypothetical protein
LLKKFSLAIGSPVLLEEVSSLKESSLPEEFTSLLRSSQSLLRESSPSRGSPVLLEEA